MEFDSLAQYRGGSIVALEGDVNTISTQLRLLPPSRKILIIPSLTESIAQEPLQQPFNARAFIRNVHLTLQRHTETARSFLESSTTKHPRLAFMNGGSVCARTTCILKISEQVTNGDIHAAETIFNKTIRYGLASLFKKDKTIAEGRDEYDFGDERTVITGESQSSSDATEIIESTTSGPHGYGSRLKNEFVPDSEVDDCDGTISNEGSSVSQSDRSNQESMSETASSLHSPYEDEPFFKAGLTAKSRRIMNSEPNILRRHSFTAPDSHYLLGNFDESDFEKDDVSSIFASPSVVYGEACLVDVQTTPGKQLSRAMSVDRFSTSKSSSPEFSRDSIVTLKPATSSPRYKSSPIPAEYEGWCLQTLPKKTFVKASTTTIKKSPPRRTSTEVPERIEPEAAEPTEPSIQTTMKENIFKKISNVHYEPVFPLEEDLIIHFNTTGITQHNQVVDSIISSYKDGSYPILPPAPKPVSIASSMKSIAIHDATEDYTGIKDSHNDGDAIFTVEFEDESPEPEPGQFDEYDPFHTSCARQLWPSQKLDRSDSGVQMPDFQPSPQIVAEPPNGRSERFVELFAADSTTPVLLQDALRRLLTIHFPAGDNGYSQHYFTTSPESDRLWKPVFRNDRDPNSKSNTVDQIIALGSETGVPRDFLSQISGHIENLDARKDGISRSSKLDITYLISNLVQSYHDTPFADQSTFNPLSDPQTLAALLIPQLEAYLASNKDIHLLILKFPANHLATVLSLRSLLGMDIFRVAGVLNSLPHDPPACITRPTTALSRHNSNSVVADLVVSRLRQKHSHTESLPALNRNKSMSTPDLSIPEQGVAESTTENAASFAEANHLLPCTANDTEIASFIAGIWKALQVDKPSIYVFEPDLEIMIVERLLAPSPVNIPKNVNPPPTAQLPPIPTRRSRNSSAASVHGYGPRLGRSPTRRPRESSPLANGDFINRRAASSYTPSPARHVTNARIPRDRSVSSFSQIEKDEEYQGFSGLDQLKSSAYTLTPETPRPIRVVENRQSTFGEKTIPRGYSPSPSGTPGIEFEDVDVSELSQLETFFNPTPPLPPLTQTSTHQKNFKSLGSIRRSKHAPPPPSEPVSTNPFPKLEDEPINPSSFEKTEPLKRASTNTKSRIASSVLMPSRFHRMAGYAGSIASVKTTKTAKTMGSTKTGASRASRTVRNAEGDWETFYISDVDSEDDEFDRMILGRKHARIVPEVRREEGLSVMRKRDKSKALKFLGLA